jgi:peptidoglycan/xylan/chitin deacetylase (PgdA/CDA1 family)
MTAIPVLLYHSVADAPSSWISGFTVTPATFERHMDAVVASGRTAMTVRGLRDNLRLGRPLPERPVLITFDDGFADTATVAGPALARRGLCSTVYVTTAVIGGVSPGEDAMVDWSQIEELSAMGTEIGAHSHTHPELDMLPEAAVRHEVELPKRMLEERLGEEVPSFAYPFGYSNPMVRRLVSEAGYASACSVKNALSSSADPSFAIARLTVTSRTSDGRMRQWLEGGGAPVGRRQERLVSRGWRTWRRTRSRWRAPDAWTPAGSPS